MHIKFCLILYLSVVSTVFVFSASEEKREPVTPPKAIDIHPGVLNRAHFTSRGIV